MNKQLSHKVIYGTEFIACTKSVIYGSSLLIVVCMHDSIVNKSLIKAARGVTQLSHYVTQLSHKVIQYGSSL